MERAKEELKGHDVVACDSEQEAYNEYFSCFGSQAAFDVLLCDLMLPAGKYTENDSASMLTGSIHMSGLLLCMLAAKRGIKKIGLVTSEWHHKNPAGRLLEDLTTLNNDEWGMCKQSPKKYRGYKHVIKTERAGLIISVCHEEKEKE